MSVRSFLCFLLFAAVLVPFGTWAQEKTPLIRPGLRFDRYFSNDGLPDNRVRNLYQDTKGYLWVGTMNGLCRFDGYTFRKFHNQGINDISASWAYAIAEDENTDLYIGSRNGLSKFIRSKESFVPVHRPEHVKTGFGPVTALCSKSRRLWVGTPTGLLHYNPQTGQYKAFNAYPLNRQISKIIVASDDHIWIGTDAGIVRLNTKTLKFEFFRIDIRPNPYGDKIWSMLEDNGSLFIGTGGDGLIKLVYDANEKRYSGFEHLSRYHRGGQMLAGKQVFDLVRSPQGEIWMATENGLARIRNLQGPSAPEYFRNNSLDNNSISNNIIYKLLIDQTGVLWCGTELGLNKSDLNLLAFSYFTFSGSSSADIIRSIASSNGQDVFLGTASSGLLKYDISSGRCSSLPPIGGRAAFNAYRSLYIDRGILWGGTLGGTLKIAESNIRSSISIMNEHATFATLRDSKGNFWTGTNHGIFLVDKNGKEIDLSVDKDAPDVVKTGFVRQIYEDSRGNIWLGFENSGLIVFEPGSRKYSTVISRDPLKQFLGNSIISITEYPAQTMWVGTEAGLNKISLSRGSLDNWNLRAFTEEDGLPDKSVNGILSSDNGLIWVSTIKGLARLQVRNNSIQTYLSNVNFSIGSCYKSHPRKLLFGTSNGFIAFDPYKIPAGGKGPMVAISEFRLSNRPVEIGKEFNGDVILDKSLSATKEVILNYHNNVFSIAFTALHYSNPEENRYSYKMEGFDDKWVSADASARTASYTNLDPGTYYFKVRAASYMNNWSSRPAVLKITILPPPWKTWWAIVLYVLLFHLLLWILIHYVLLQSRQRQEIEYQKVEKEQLRQLNDMKLDFFTNISHEFRTPLTLISAPVEELLRTPGIAGSERSKVNLIYRNCRKLLQLLDELMTFQKAEQGMLRLKVMPLSMTSFLQVILDNFQALAERNKVCLRFEDRIGEAVASFDPDKIEMVLNNLISNALKFTDEGGEICLRLSEESNKEGERFMVISVDDNGRGIRPEELPHIFDRYHSEHNKKGTGLGLALTKTLVELHKGSIEVSSVHGKSTSCRIKLPYAQVSVADVSEKVFVPDLHPVDEEDLSGAEGDTSGTVKEHKILIVDDNKEILDYLQLLLYDRYHIIKAVNGRDALEKLEAEEPDLIISDLMMPEIDGGELCRRVKSNLNTSHIPFILLTAKTTDEDRLLGFKTGADDYISKPFHPEILKVRAEKMIGYHQHLREKYKGDGVIIPEDIAKNPLDEKFLQKVLDTIQANRSNDEFSVEDLGEALCMSRSNLFRKLKAITGQTPIELIYQVRIKHSMELLLERKLSISEIAYEVGFKNPSSFTSSFKKQYGKSPKEYLNDVLKQHSVD